MPKKKMTQRSDGLFRIRYHGKDFYGRTQEEAQRKRDEWVFQENEGVDHSLDKVTFESYAKNWLKVYRTCCGVSQQNQYMGFINYAAERLKPEMKEITATDLQRMCNALSTYSSSYVSKFMTTIRGIFRSALADGIIVRNPMETVKRPKTQKTEGHRALEPWERELVKSTCHEHDFGLCALTMLYAGLRRGEALYLDVDRDVDFEARTITVRGAVSFSNGNRPMESPGKTEAAQRVVPLVKPLADALRGHHGLLCPKEDGGLMTQIAFTRKYESYINYLETKLNGCPKRWYGKTKIHKALLAEGKTLPEWREVTIRCHDFRVDFCTRAYEAGIPVKTLQHWMGHTDATVTLSIYTKLSEQQAKMDSSRISDFFTTPEEDH